MNQVAESLELLIGTMSADMSNLSREDSLEIFNRIREIYEMAQAYDEISDRFRQVVFYNSELRRKGLELVEASVFVVREFDGTHRLALAASKFVEVVANEGRRNEIMRYDEP